MIEVSNGDTIQGYFYVLFKITGVVNFSNNKIDPMVVIAKAD